MLNEQSTGSCHSPTAQKALFSSLGKKIITHSHSKTVPYLHSKLHRRARADLQSITKLTQSSHVLTAVFWAAFSTFLPRTGCFSMFSCLAEFPAPLLEHFWAAKAVQRQQLSGTYIWYSLTSSVYSFWNLRTSIPNVCTSLE